MFQLSCLNFFFYVWERFNQTQDFVSVGASMTLVLPSLDSKAMWNEDFWPKMQQS